MQGKLILSGNNSEILVQAKAGQIFVDLPTDFKLSLYSVRDFLKSRAVNLDFVQEVLSRMDVVVTFRLAGRAIASIGGGSRPGIMARILQVNPMQVKVLPILAAMLDQNASEISRRLLN